MIKYVVIFVVVATLRENLQDIEYVEFEKKGHFCLGDLDTEEFPELLNVIIK